MTCDILGVAFDCLTLPDSVELALAFLAEDGTHIVVTPNAEIVWMAERSPQLRQALNAANMVLPDGVGIVKAARALGHPLRERVSGIDFAERLLPRLAKRETPVFLYGGKPDVAEQAARRISAAHPGLNIVGTRDGYSAAGSESEIAAAIKESGALVLFVCLGAPKQELFMRHFGCETGARLLVGLGGTLDVWAGNLKRAPAIFIKLGLEWLYRLLRQPKRLFRIFRLPSFLWAVRRQKRRIRKQTPWASAQSQPETDSNVHPRADSSLRG